jgi:transketolase
MSKTIRQEFADTMLEVGQKDDNLVVLIADISYFILQPFAKAYPERFYNVGICEPTVINMAAGLAKLGFFPVVHTFTPFLIERSFEQIKLNFGYQKLGVNLISIGSVFDYSTHGCTHHCYDDFALLKNVQGMQIMYPASCKEFNLLFKQTYNNGLPNYIRIAKHQHDIMFDDAEIQFGKGIRIKEGSDLTIIAVGSQLKTAINAVELLKQNGISVEIIYIHTIKPFDEGIVKESLSKTKHCLTIEEHSMYGGVFEEVLRCTRNLGGVKYESINTGDKFIHEYGTYEQHCKRLGFSEEVILEKSRQLLEKT